MEKETKSKFKGVATNKHFATFFMVMFFLFFFIFVANRYTMNLIMSIIMLQFSLSFKTWHLIREIQNGTE